MDLRPTIRALAALAGETRLSAVVELSRSGEQGLAAGELAVRLAVPRNALSQHLRILEAAGLVEHERLGRSIVYRVRKGELDRLLASLSARLGL